MHRNPLPPNAPARIGLALTLLAVVALISAPRQLAAQGAPSPPTPVPGLQAESVHEAIAAFRDQLRRDVAEDNVGGITAAVVVGDRMIWAEGFGWADRERGIPAAVESIYRIGSISKPVTAIVLAQLADRGVLDLDDPVARHLPEAVAFDDPLAGPEAVTFRRLATHTAGLIREPRLEGAASGPIEEWEAKVLESIPATGFLAEPGERVSYSNIGFGTLGLALGRAEGHSFMDQVVEGIFEPLGMRSSTFVVPSELETLLAVGYQNRSDGSLNAEGPAREHRGRGYKVPNGGVYSTVGDMARLIAAMSGRAGESLMREEMRLEMLRRQTPGDEASGYGLGWNVRVRDDGRSFVGHGGSVAGYTAHMVFEPESGIGVILLRNYNSGATNLGSVATDLLNGLLETR
ncbi:MAG: class A beta-lactamase-related serine hydrolase [Gemmatimonadales bacterium]|nr:MAG: class A beta-lactamase-related serine hydrolase [Gemmatimonadales bacterium]